MEKQFPVIDLFATGENISRLRKERGLSVRDMQNWFGFEEPQAIYKWQWGKCLPSVDNLLALSTLLDVPIEAILITSTPTMHIANPQSNFEAAAPVTGATASAYFEAIFPLSHGFEYGRSQSPWAYHFCCNPVAQALMLSCTRIQGVCNLICRNRITLDMETFG